MVRPILALDRLSFLEREGWVGYRHGDDSAELERMDYLELIARVTSRLPDKGQVMVRFGILTSGRGGDILLFVRGRVDRESAAGDIRSSAKRKFLRIRHHRTEGRAPGRVRTPSRDHPQERGSLHPKRRPAECQHVRGVLSS
jgi:hypothetical protein